MFTVQIIHNSYEYAITLARKLSAPAFSCKVVDISLIGFIGMQRFRTRKPDAVIFSTELSTMSIEEFVLTLNKMNRACMVVFLSPGNQPHTIPKDLSFPAYSLTEDASDDEILSVLRSMQQDMGQHMETFNADPSASFEALISSQTHGEMKSIIEELQLPKPYSFARLLILVLREDYTSKQIRNADSRLLSMNIGRAFLLSGSRNRLILFLSNATPVTDKEAASLLKQSSIYQFAGISCEYLPVYYIRDIYERMSEQLPKLYYLQNAEILELSSSGNETVKPISYRSIRTLTSRVLYDFIGNDASSIDKDLLEICNAFYSSAFDPDSAQKIRTLIQLLIITIQALVTGEPISSGAYSAHSFKMFYDEYEYLRSTIFRYLEQREQKRSSYPQMIIIALSYIDEHLFEPIALSDVADHLHLSREYLSSEFSRHTGIPMTKYINTQKITACMFLICTGSNQAEAAKATGFSDAKYFSRLFKQNYSMTPSHFRDNLLKENSMNQENTL